MVERLLTKHLRIFARHRLNVGTNIEFKNRSNPKDYELVYTQKLPTPTNKKDEMLGEPAFQQEYVLNTILLFSKYSSPLFAQRKSNRKLGFLVDL